jgi:antitoxin PrlF
MISNKPIPPISTLTKKYQTTIPAEVRKKLGLQKNDKIVYTFTSNNQVMLTRLDSGNDDQAIEAFLDFLEKDIVNCPENLQPITKEIVESSLSLASSGVIDINAPLTGEE